MHTLRTGLVTFRNFNRFQFIIETFCLFTRFFERHGYIKVVLPQFSFWNHRPDALPIFVACF